MSWLWEANGMNLIQIEYFLKLAELGSFRRTAEALYISQPAVSKQISLLEKEWGFPLFDRSYRSVKLTQSGKIMLEVLKESTEKFDDALIRAKRQSKQYTLELRMGLPEYANMGDLDELLAQFQRDNPTVILKVRYVPLSMLELSEGGNDFDLVVNYERNLRGKNHMESRTLGTRRHMAIVSRDHPAVQKEHPRFEDLIHERVYVPSNDNSNLTTDYCVFICNNHGFTPAEVECLPNIESVLMAVKMGFGYAVLDNLLELPPRFQLISLPTNVRFDVKLAWKKEDQNPMLKKLVTYICEGLHLGPVGETDGRQVMER